MAACPATVAWRPATVEAHASWARAPSVVPARRALCAPAQGPPTTTIANDREDDGHAVITAP
jgi:predicted short-subunit dehydrogenase-like oxidoreductase (DUF2520 family)